jgi:long-chain acyl-CoA synthetase
VNLAAIIEGHAGEGVAVVDGDEALTYRDLRRAVGGVRGALSSAGVRSGDRVALIAANGADFVVAHLAILGAGAVTVPLNPTSPPAEVQDQLAAVEPVAAILGKGASIPPASAVGLRLVLDHDGLVAAQAGAEVPMVDRGAADLAVLIFTAGTAGAPKAAMLSHGNVLANIAQVQAHPGQTLTGDDVVLGVLPLFHIFGLTVVLGITLAAGGTIVMEARFEPADALALVAAHRVTVLVGAPPLFGALLTSAPAADGANPLGTVRLALSGAAPLAEGVARAFAARFGVEVHQGYGLTEASPVVTASPIAAGARPRHGSIGVPVPGVEVRLVDEDGEDAYVGDPGEIWVRGANVFGGYWRDEAATRSVLTPDGWLRTGDIAVAGEDGLLQIVDRAKDLIIVSGFNVSPAEVEETLREHPDVVDVAVVGVPDDRTGEAVSAVVVAAPGTSPDAAELGRFCADRLARYKCPTRVSLATELPLGLAGKVLRRRLRPA